MPSRGFVLKVNRDRNRPMAKMNKGQLADALAAHDRVMALSCEIRERSGLAPLDDNQLISEARARMSRSKAPVVLQGADALADLVRRRRRLERDREAFDNDLARLVGSGEVAMSMIARSMGVSRQRIYQIREQAA